MFSGCTLPPDYDSKETKLGSSNQEASPSGGKNAGIVLVPCPTWKGLWDIMMHDPTIHDPTMYDSCINYANMLFYIEINHNIKEVKV